MSQPESVILETGADPEGTIIWLHGLGADGHDFEAIVPELRLPETLPLRFVFPHAPVRPVTVNGGMAMRAWYDIRSFDAEGRADETGVRESSALLDSIVAAQIERGMPAKRIVLAGFSQGGAIVLHNALRSEHQLAGLMALSTYMPLPHLFGSEVVSQADALDRAMPVFMAHGSQDPMVPLAAGAEAAEMLRTAGFEVEWHDYPMAHGVCPQEIVDIRAWLIAVYDRAAATSK